MAAKEERSCRIAAALPGDPLGPVSIIGNSCIDEARQIGGWRKNCYIVNNFVYAQYPGTAFYQTSDDSAGTETLVDFKPCVPKAVVPRAGDLCKFKVTFVQCSAVYGTITELNGESIPHAIPALVERRDATDLEEKRVFLQELFIPGEEYDGVIVSLNDNVKPLVSTAIHFREMLMGKD